MSELPTSIPFADIEAAFASLGIPVAHTMSVTFGTSHVTVEQVRIDGDGKYLAAGSHPATVTTIIGYDRNDYDGGLK